jgi:hypothetical protein
MSQAASESTMDISTRMVEDVLRMAQCRADNTAIIQQVETGDSDLEEIEQRLAESTFVLVVHCVL